MKKQLFILFYTLVLSAFAGQAQCSLHWLQEYNGRVNCYGGTGGGVQAKIGGGVAPYTWTYSGGSNPYIAPDYIWIYNLPAGNYTIGVTDANGCHLSTTLVVAQPGPYVITPSQTNLTCGGDNSGAASIAVSGSNTSYTYAWSDGGSNGPSKTGLAAGTHSVTVTDNYYCTATHTFTITEPEPIVASIASESDVSCYGGSNGTALVTATGGTGTLSYAWSNGATSNSISGLTEGNYTATVTDGTGCQKTVTASITEPEELLLSVASASVTCFGADDSWATASAIGGIAPYTYSWAHTAATTNELTGLAGGNYTATVTDFNGCTAMSSFAISAPASALSVTASKTDVSCNGEGDGTAAITVTGGYGNYTYEWSNDETTTTLSDLSGGTYTVTVTDGGDCTAIESITIEENDAISLSGTAELPACADSETWATVTPSGGAGGFTYEWETGGTDATETGLLGGDYSVTVTDADGCQATRTFYLTAPSAITVISGRTDLQCNGVAAGEATVSVTGGAGNYTYDWTSGGTTDTETDLQAGTYTVTITDASGCTAEKTFTITEPEAVTATIAQTNVSCFGEEDGEAVATPDVSGDYEYYWDNEEGTNEYFDLAAGTYTFSMTDENGCESEVYTITITEPQVLEGTITGTNACFDADNGTAVVTATGGTGDYDYVWSTEDESGTITDLAPGTYTVDITDENGCEATQFVTISEEAAINAAVTMTGNVITAAQAGASYRWIDCDEEEFIAGATSQTFTPVANGNYAVEVTVNDCSEISECMTIATIGLNELSVTGMSVYPNPSNGQVTIEVAAATEVVIYDMIGNIVYAETAGAGKNTIDLTTAATGMYTIKATANGVSQTVKWSKY